MYNIMIRHLYVLPSDHPDKSSTEKFRGVLSVHFAISHGGKLINLDRLQWVLLKATEVQM